MKNIERKHGLIDPIYKKYNDNVFKAMEFEEFYNYFLDNVEAGKRSIQFSNRKLEKKIDEKWIVAVENCMQPFENIIMNPRNFIVEQEEIVNVAVARQSTPDVLKHLTTHGKYIDEISDDNVRPNHLLNKFKEESWNTYENRFVYTLLEKTTQFVNKRYNGIFENLDGEFGAFLKVESLSKNDADTVSTKLDVRVRQNEDYLADDEGSISIFDRLKKINDTLMVYCASDFATIMKKYPRVKNPIVKTNAIQKNPNFKACYKLWVFIYAYKELGYEINIYEQNAEITPSFEKDINNSLFLNYLILKNHLESDDDRGIDISKPFKKRVLKPKYIKKIVEELVDNYDISDTEVRKILIEEFTRAQLEQLEEKERRQLVMEQEREKAERRRREAEVKKKEQEKRQRERAKRLKAKEAMLAKQVKAKERHDALVAKLVESCIKQTKRFEDNLPKALKSREKFFAEETKIKNRPEENTKVYDNLFLTIDQLIENAKKKNIAYEEIEDQTANDIEFVEDIILEEENPESKDPEGVYDSDNNLIDDNVDMLPDDSEIDDNVDMLPDDSEIDDNGDMFSDDSEIDNNEDMLPDDSEIDDKEDMRSDDSEIDDNKDMLPDELEIDDSKGPFWEVKDSNADDSETKDSNANDSETKNSNANDSETDVSAKDYSEKPNPRSGRGLDIIPERIKKFLDILK